MSLNKFISDCFKSMSSESFEIQRVTSRLQRITQYTKQERSRNEVDDPQWSVLSKILSEACKMLDTSIGSEELDFMCELFRVLRNICAGCRINQKYVFSHKVVFNDACKILLHFAQSHKENSNNQETTALQCGLQFFGNLCQYTPCKNMVWSYFRINNIFGLLLRSKIFKVQEYTMMILYNCTTEEKLDFFIEFSEGRDLLMLLTKCLCENLVDWGMFFMYILIEKDGFMDRFYDALPISSRLLILDLITECLEQNSESPICKVPFITIKQFAHLFVANAMDFVKICSPDIPDLKPIEISKLLALLCAASAHDKYNAVLKEKLELTEVTVDVLKSVHLLGKTENNIFSSLSNLRDTTQVEKEEIEQNPSYGFKKNLIRFIGNISSQSKANQDLIRKLDGIPLLLDCCNLDARNPYIMQWCILGIRNILKNNQENQEVLAKISVTGGLADSALLKELGLEVHMQDEKPVLRQLKKRAQS